MMILQLYFIEVKITLRYKSYNGIVYIIFPFQSNADFIKH